MTNQPQRLLALDVMRGITIAGMIMVNNPGSWKYVYAPLQHAPWNGLTPTDLVFPFFMFIMGVSIHISFRKYGTGLNRTVGTKILRRTLSLFAVGLVLEAFSGICAGTFSIEHFRIMGVMQRLALTYGGAALLTQTVSKKHYLWVIGGILTAYLLILQLGNGYVQSADNLLSVVDVNILGAAHMAKEILPDGSSFPFDPLGLLSTIPGIAHVMLGVCAGNIITSVKDNHTRIEQLFTGGSILLFTGYLLQYLDPVNKKLWTSSYVLLTCGMGALLLALLIWTIDIKGRKKWSRFFQSFGVNPLFMYVLGWVAAVLLNTTTLHIGSNSVSIKKLLYGSVLQPLFGDYPGSLVYAILFICFIWTFGYVLYKKKIYIKL
ncbi:MAG: heparan-alpha-glucosaminide N-acetyltransferase domain-containing protein [Bacteroides sp.]|nr:heparan-alpha-glucosaminide N-acetyltransferase domain-containing protein [Bacteroides sp.]